MKLKNEKWGLDKFQEIREEVLQEWPTGQEVNLEDAIEYQKSLSAEQVMTQQLAEAKEKGDTLIQPRAGVALIEEHIELLKYLTEEGQADLLPTTIDSYTRQNNYQEAEEGIKESREEGRSMLNGFPAVNHGVEGCRQVIEAVDAPVQVRHGTPDARLLAEITLAGGFTDYEGGGISYNIPYAKDVSLRQTICDWQYVDRLIGLYEERGISINREPFGPLTGTLVPPSISHSIALIEGLLAAEQGVRNITLGYGQCGNLVQDVAALQTLEELAEEYLADYDDVMLTTVFHQWMGGFPQDEAQAFGVISWGAATAALGEATKVITKTPHEALGVPTKEANAQGLKSTKQLINMLRNQQLLSNEELATEKAMIKQETTEILDRVFELGAGDLAQGTVRAFEAGVLDVPFAPSRYNANNLLPARDNNGAVRYLNYGNLPFSEEVIDFNQEKLEERGAVEGREPNFQMVTDDIYAIGKGMLVGRPRS
ncbi:methylaspartate mutase subunit E [Halanaerobaculum tunisiense]